MSESNNAILRAVTSENIEKSATLDERAVAAKQSENEAEQLIRDFQAFLRTCVSRYSVYADASQREEMFSSAMLAFYEAIQKYDASKGHFFYFARQIVYERLIDYNRKAIRQAALGTSPLELEDEEQATSQSAAINAISIRHYQADQNHARLLDEIEQFKAELTEWGLTMASLVDQSPKHRKLREEYRMVVQKIAQSPDIVQTIQVKHYFPVKAVEKISGIPQKKLERARNFILASLIIKMGDYDYLSDYISDRRYSI